MSFKMGRLKKGSPLWEEWQRLQAHSEFDRWADIYDSPQPILRWQIYCDWLQENGFLLEYAEVREYVFERGESTLNKPTFYA